MAIPIFDMQKVDGLAEAMVKACEEWGCFRIINHGVPKELMAEMKVVVASLFDQPEDIKKRILNNEHFLGYIGHNLVGPFFEGFGIDEISSYESFCDRLDASTHQRDTICKYIKAMRDLAELLGKKLMEGTCLTGDLFEGWCCQLRMNKYHFCPESLGTTSIAEHSDPSFLTILQDDEDINGLQMADKYSGEFAPFDPVPGTLAVNIGDMGKAWSNGRFYNVKHRVMCSNANTRYSIAFFVLGPNDKKVEAPSEFVDSENPRLYAPIDIGEYRRARTAAKLTSGGTLDLFKTTPA